MHLLPQLSRFVLLAFVGCAISAYAAPADDAKTVAELDVAYQAAVLRNDADSMDKIFHPDFTLVHGDGRVTDRAFWLNAAREKSIVYEHQEAVDGSRKVRVAGDTAVVTAKLWIKGVRKAGSAVDVALWYSDTYVRTPAGWKYFFGQASLPLPKN
ncbi:MAG TPA: nuclear transport factor 2 family protein [Burkholderiaceae bacterium]